MLLLLLVPPVIVLCGSIAIVVSEGRRKRGKKEIRAQAEAFQFDLGLSPGIVSSLKEARALSVFRSDVSTSSRHQTDSAFLVTGLKHRLCPNGKQGRNFGGVPEQ